MVLDVKVSEGGVVEILLRLDQNFRKVKTICLTTL